MPRPKIIYKPLGRKKPKHLRCTCGASKGTDFGRWKGTISFKPAGGTIFIDPRQSPKEQANTLLHELLHDAMPQLDEMAITWIADHIAESLWAEGYRKQDK